ncbi:NAD(+) diphosphatase [Raineyella sp.]|uniref:NAD(+) diphosphatase n=1 Tax=Raineyella sp. TaxID=1911550 RepID=UPI002B20A813|nr:NAD(+) diphosphatase [Raineyella sp.]MEA5154714.1 NAD(+) diphosphatase [Raineyella sp.]
MDWSAASGLDRSEEHREDAAWVRRQWESPAALLLPVGPGGRLPVGPGPALRYLPTTGDRDPATTHLLGTADDRPVFCRVVDEVEGETASVREIGHRLTGTQADVAFSATSLANWHRIEPRCSACGALTQPRRAGLMRHCPECGRDTWPRTDPAVIVAVTNADDEILLAHQPVWAAGRVSVLAGFVETGESLEQAIHREILEESGVTLGEVRYVASQPWPYPRSLMLGFRARATSTRIIVDTAELAWGRWFSRAAVRAGSVDGSLVLPPASSIARRLIEDWLGEDATRSEGPDRH